MFKIIAVISVKPEFAEKTAAMLPALIAGSRKDAGNVEYDIQPDALNKGTFLAQECWKDQAALDAHLAQPHFTAFAAAVEPLLAAPMALHKIEL